MLGTGSWCFTSDAVSQKDETVIVGSKGQISFTTFGDGVFRLETSTRDETLEFDLPEHIQEFLIRDVVNELLGRGSCPSTGDSAARTNRAMEMIFESSGR